MPSGTGIWDNHLTLKEFSNHRPDRKRLSLREVDSSSDGTEIFGDGIGLVIVVRLP
jgi:hypothetical protein